MVTRSYRQFCGVAEALDVLGERWTLLVVRDLLPGPQRFSDLAARQPLISSDLLTSRLRRLEQHGLLERRPLPAPARGSMYQLTESGRALRGVIGELARLGAAWLPDPITTDRRIDPAWAAATIAEHLAHPAPTPRGLAIVCDGESVALEVDDQGCTARYGPFPDADVTLSGPTRTVLGVIIGRLSLDDHRDSVAVDGDPSDVAAWLHAIRDAVPFFQRTHDGAAHD